jgi:glutamate N-acetyltransferase/amino-acid N-acetyltransferase
VSSQPIPPDVSAVPANPVLAVPGFRASGIHCGIKKSVRDLALIVSEVPASVAGVFTRSTVVGAPVELCRERIRGGLARAIVVNSGCSNVAMGERGRRDAIRMAALVAKVVDCPDEQVFVASTGVIGQPLPMKALRSGIPRAFAALTSDGLIDAAEAIRTTDTFPKWASRQVRIGGRDVTIAGIAKGSGMISPDMATMLSFILTDADVSPVVLRGLLRRVADDTFNRVSVDGESSTSDSLLLLANGLAANRRLARAGDRDLARFETGVHEVAQSLAMDLARDGEGATKLVTVRVGGARDARQAEVAARRIANSMLVKTALFGRDPNWGRILQTIGAGRVDLVTAKTIVKLAGVTVFRAGRPTGPAARRKAQAALAAREIEIAVELGAGKGAARMWTCDLSYDYVRINAEYTT